MLTFYLIAEAGKYTCKCNCGWTGTNCDSIVNQCQSNPCMNGAICQNNGCDYRCICPPLYTGSRCDIKISYCASQPCLNGAICSDTQFGFQCDCLAGYTGQTCGNLTNVNYND